MFTVKKASLSNTLLISLRCPHGFDEDHLDLEMGEDALGGGGGWKITRAFYAF
jgi:hypothetical protein